MFVTWLGSACAPGPGVAPAVAVDGATDDAARDGASGVEDGVPMRVACTRGFGSALSMTYGRLDGRLVALVPPDQRGCGGDADHLHLQVLVGGEVYDVAVTETPATPDVAFDEIRVPLPDAAWSDGWHPDLAPLDYPTTFGVHGADFTPLPQLVLLQRVETALARANHVAIFATGYGASGVHKVHRNPGGDGAIVLDPLSASADVLLFHFATQSF